LFRCLGQVSKQPKQTKLFETNRRNLQKTLSVRVSSKQLIFFPVQQKQTKTNRKSFCFGCFSVCAEGPKKFFGLFRIFRLVSKQPKQTKLMVRGIKKVNILTNLLLFQLVFCLFRLFRNTKTPCFERNNRNKHLVSDSAETYFGSSFGCFDTKLVSEDTQQQHKERNLAVTTSGLH
jgi:hypothetical protein